MMYYSTNGKAAPATLRHAVVKGLAEDRGLYVPERIQRLSPDFFANFRDMDFAEIACHVADAFFGVDIPQEALHRIVRESLSFDCPIVPVDADKYALELFHGPTLAFKDVGARFMARMLRHFSDGELNVLVATSGDTGSAVANGFLGVEGIRVFVLYPEGKVSPIQECQFTTLGQNITAIAVDGVFDDCQALVKQAFMDASLNEERALTSANSINVARFLPQSFYYFWACAQLKRRGVQEAPVICVPSGNFGNICAALYAKRMGLDVKRFIAANNANSVFYEYLRDGQYRPRPSVQTIANAMDVGDPSNFARVLHLYGSHAAICADISGATYNDTQIAQTIRDVKARTGYLCDPHGACGYRALAEGLQAGETGIFCETAHPAKFMDTVEAILGEEVTVPEKLLAFTRGQRQSVRMPNDYAAFRTFLLEHTKSQIQ
ncbi:MAG: threonine synthase [Bacteroidales bacterium]|nr:threonine synthase [Bacteroidales bacterium]